MRSALICCLLRRLRHERVLTVESGSAAPAKRMHKAVSVLEHNRRVLPRRQYLKAVFEFVPASPMR
jgi:hypothetical protein